MGSTRTQKGRTSKYSDYCTMSWLRMLLVLGASMNAMGFVVKTGGIWSAGQALSFRPRACAGRSPKTSVLHILGSATGTDAQETGDGKVVATECVGQEMKRLSRGAKDFLAGTSWILKLDIGREPGTWMDIRWGNSAQRVKCAVAVSLQPGRNIKSRLCSIFMRKDTGTLNFEEFEQEAASQFSVRACMHAFTEGCMDRWMNGWTCMYACLLASLV